MHIKISRVEEHTTRVQQTVDGVGETLRPIGSVSIEFKFEGGGDQLRRLVKGSRGFGQLMDDGHAYHLRVQHDGYAWVSVTYKIRPATANPYNAGNTNVLKKRALAAIQRKVKNLFDES